MAYAMINPKLISQIPSIKKHASELLFLANDISSSRRGPYQMDDYLGAMADAFIHMQIDDLKSICILVENDQNPNVLTIARSAHEHMVLLLWAAHGPNIEERPRKWFANEYFERYREIVEGKYNDTDIESKVKTDIYQGVQEHADLFLTNKAEDDLRQGKTLSNDPFIKGLPSNNWARVNELTEKGYINDKSYQLYELLSQWTHATPQGLALVYRHDGNRFLRDEPMCEYLGACAIMIGIQSLSNTAVLFNNHFKLNFHDRLKELEKQNQELYPETKSENSDHTA